jgi:hypothetical protein
MIFFYSALHKKCNIVNFAEGRSENTFCPLSTRNKNFVIFTKNLIVLRNNLHF